ncbi:MAG: L-seryl-tRNA(Sec) selenium transferase [Candidatus Promineifilaceae bacterium]
MSHKKKMTPAQIAQLRQLPSVDQLLSDSLVQALIATFGRDLVVEAARHTLNSTRNQIRNGATSAITADNASLITQIDRWLQDLVAPTLYPVINATGVVIHTNLGRAPLSQPATDAIAAIATGYSNLEFDIPSGKRGSRSVHAIDLVQRLTGAESATVVNNTASAMILMLSALCAGREVIISRGQLVEIGGGFRMPDVMRQAGAKLVEVGTTNRTHLRDYANAITDNTAAILSVHHSNYKIIGFTTEPELADLATLAHDNNVPLLFDQGSGALLDSRQFGLAPEPRVQDAIADGCDIVAFSGDKLIGGPQAGVICGRADLVATIKRHPLARAVRPDKLCYAGLTATLGSYVRGAAVAEIPIWQMIAQSAETLTQRATVWQQSLSQQGVNCHTTDGFSTVGGGSLPGQTMPTTLLVLEHPQPEKVAARLRTALALPIIGRIQDNTLRFDPRTVLPSQEPAFLHGLVSS